MPDPIYRFLAVRPDLPHPAQWSPILEEAYRRNWFTNFGALSRSLENKLEAQWGGAGEVCVLASSGTAAIAAPLIAAGIEGTVLLPAFTFPATASAVRMAGATPQLIDVNPVSWSVSPQTLRAAFTDTGAKAAVVVSPFGVQVDFREHASIAAEHNAILVIDSAAGLGGNRSAHSDAPHVFEAYSLHATKPFGIGEGGAIFSAKTNEPTLRSALNFGLASINPDGPPSWGINGKMSEFHAAIGLAVIKNFQEKLAQRRAIAARYICLVNRWDSIVSITQPSLSTWQVFPLLLPSEASAEKLIAETRKRGMEVRRYYRPSLSSMPNSSVYKACPVSEDLARRMCCLPVYSNAEPEERAEMLAIVEAALIAVLGEV